MGWIHGTKQFLLEKDEEGISASRCVDKAETF
jgi:hypothetical protein